MVSEDTVSKIQKLLRLSGSSNPHEAALAAAKAQELMFKYNLDMAEIQQQQEQKSDYQNEFWDKVNMNYRPWSDMLQGVATCNFCFIVVVGRGKEKRPWIIGERHNVEFVKWLFSSLKEEMQRQENRAFRESGNGTGRKAFWNAFNQGFANVIRQRLSEQMKASRSAVESNSMALVIVKDRELEEATKHFFPFLVYKKRRRGTIGDWDAFLSGQKAGSKANLNRPMESENRRSLLTASN